MELLKLMARSKEAAEHTISCYLNEIERTLGEEYIEVAGDRRRSNRSGGASARSGKPRGLVCIFCIIYFVAMLDR